MEEKLQEIVEKYIQPIWYKVRFAETIKAAMYIKSKYSSFKNVDFDIVIRDHFKYNKRLEYSKYNDNKMIGLDIWYILVKEFCQYSDYSEVQFLVKRQAKKARIEWIEEFKKSKELQLFKDFQENLKRQYNRTISQNYSSHYLQSESSEVEDMFRGHSFTWTYTPQGHYIWAIINICFLLAVPVKLTDDIYRKLISVKK